MPTWRSWISTAPRRVGASAQSASSIANYSSTLTTKGRFVKRPCQHDLRNGAFDAARMHPPKALPGLTLYRIGNSAALSVPFWHIVLHVPSPMDHEPQGVAMVAEEQKPLGFRVGRISAVSEDTNPGQDGRLAPTTIDTSRGSVGDQGRNPRSYPRHPAKLPTVPTAMHLSTSIVPPSHLPCTPYFSPSSPSRDGGTGGTVRAVIRRLAVGVLRCMAVRREDGQED